MICVSSIARAQSFEAYVLLDNTFLHRSHFNHDSGVHKQLKKIPSSKSLKSHSFASLRLMADIPSL